MTISSGRYFGRRHQPIRSVRTGGATRAPPHLGRDHAVGLVLGRSSGRAVASGVSGSGDGDVVIGTSGFVAVRSGRRPVPAAPAADGHDQQGGEPADDAAAALAAAADGVGRTGGGAVAGGGVGQLLEALAQVGHQDSTSSGSPSLAARLRRPRASQLLTVPARAPRVAATSSTGQVGQVVEHDRLPLVHRQGPQGLGQGEGLDRRRRHRGRRARPGAAPWPGAGGGGRGRRPGSWPPAAPRPRARRSRAAGPSGSRPGRTPPARSPRPRGGRRSPGTAGRAAVRRWPYRTPQTPRCRPRSSFRVGGCLLLHDAGAPPVAVVSRGRGHRGPRGGRGRRSGRRRSASRPGRRSRRGWPGPRTARRSGGCPRRPGWPAPGPGRGPCR